MLQLRAARRALEEGSRHEKSLRRALRHAEERVLEARERFSRLQVLHLWDWVEWDLIDLGIKHVDASIFAAADFKHVATCQLQHTLLKVAQNG